MVESGIVISVDAERIVRSLLAFTGIVDHNERIPIRNEITDAFFELGVRYDVYFSGSQYHLIDQTTIVDAWRFISDDAFFYSGSVALINVDEFEAGILYFYKFVPTT